MEKPQTSIGVLDKVMDILACFDKGTPAKAPREVAEILRMPLPTVYRFMQAMAEHGLLEKDASSVSAFGLPHLAPGQQRIWIYDASRFLSCASYPEKRVNIRALVFGVGLFG